MQLIGLLDSPYVRRVAISLQLLGLPFGHRAISVFRDFEAFHQINPVVKAPTLVCDDGTILLDSTLIIDYAERHADARATLMPAVPAERTCALRLIGLALAACEKSVQIIYERELRPAEKLHQPWIARVSAQLVAAFTALELELRRQALTIEPILQAGITTAVTWYFARRMLPEVIAASQFPLLDQFSAQAERLPEFAAAPHGPGTISMVS